MGNLWPLAWRNIWRQRRRSLLSAGVVAVAVFFSLVFSGMVGAFSNAQYIGITRSVGHLSLRVKGDQEPGTTFQDSVIQRVPSVRSQLDRVGLPPDAETVTTLEVPVLLAGERRSRGVMLLGNDAPVPAGKTAPVGDLKAGRLPNRSEGDAIALGAVLARALDVNVGGSVYAYAPGTSGMGQAVYRVVGLISVPDSGSEGKIAYLPLSAAQALAAPDGASRVDIHLPALTHASDDAKVTALRDTLAASKGLDYRIQTWREAYPALAGLVSQMRPMTQVFSALFFVLAGLLVVNTIYLSLLERTRELGVIVALGATPSKVTRMILLESLLLCGVGAVIGLLLGLGVILATSQGIPSTAIPSAQVMQGASGGLPETLYPSLLPGDVIFTLAFTLLTALLSAWWPARLASRLEPVDAMRFVGP
ncbi:ABC transporter permease [Deinococcus antarcticus]|uniref:ABC transporter permease n=1 Tax=Deinococcus antarcticus TaxID=1298767 RepID=A0ABV8A584_9DEIO